jgi:hypothetical protein
VTPALLTSTSSRPKASTVSRTNRPGTSGSLRSPMTG